MLAVSSSNPGGTMSCSKRFCHDGDSAVSDAKYNHCRSFRLETDFETGIHFVDGSGRIGSDMPPRLFAIIWKIRFKAETSYGRGIDANFQTGLITNFEDSVREGWRFPGRVVTYGDIQHSNSEIGRIVVGFAHLDLEQTEIFPAGAIVFEPNPNSGMTSTSRVHRSGSEWLTTNDKDQWLYFRGEYHGSAWAIERNTGNADVV